MKEYKTYTVRKGDTLKSIAERLQINVQDLVSFHNKYSHTLLRNDFIGVTMFKEIYIPVNLEEFRCKHAPNYFPLHYGDILLSCEDIVIDEVTEMVLKEQKTIQTQTVQRFSIRQEEMDGHAVCVIDNIEILKQQISPQYKPLANAISFLGLPLKHLILGINPDGAIAKVINQKEISERWQSLKQTEEAQTLLTDKTIGKNIEQAMDTDYAQTFRVINETLRYRLLCPDFFGDQMLNEPRKRETNLMLLSNFFASHKVRFTLEESFRHLDNADGIVATQRYSAEKGMQEEFSSIYYSTLKDYLQCPMNYSMDIKCTFNMSGSPLRMQDVVCHLEERLSDTTVFVNDIHIIYNHK
ncbi:hypothetical protein PI172_2294 [Prevotella intermedia]|uniref:LysM peptidoglycan-binding domain-containing protein n=1 Tax=Prevotella intermedia TaxID=28131 RepID=A0A1P8JNV9_PREIN|nr:LysM peptidoglycan-binding domain-containing protein [Prevotella intermedia]AFJ07670.1 LysM domain protein [Prevotella intermedia 17]APW35437.1 peptidoglycan-binding protein LysM [Prevotella intermedia]ATV52130.1 LysM peptidoglycan-binding domain-containing protein [Prevotella intermedia]BAR97022.1 hypothetical protein PI172_2294 [Prevotella intermedia]